MLGEGPTFGINGSFGSPEKKFCISFSKKNTKFFLSLHYNADNSYLFINGQEIFKVKADNKNFNFHTQFYSEISINGNVYDFSIWNAYDYSSIDKSDILNIHKYLIAKNTFR